MLSNTTVTLISASKGGRLQNFGETPFQHSPIPRLVLCEKSSVYRTRSAPGFGELSGWLGIPDSPPQHDSSPSPLGTGQPHSRLHTIESSRSAQGARNTYYCAAGIASLFVDRFFSATTRIFEARLRPCRFTLLELATKNC
jgi:hypothetical protein